jgi:hypothetical protein
LKDINVGKEARKCKQAKGRNGRKEEGGGKKERRKEKENQSNSQSGRCDGHFFVCEAAPIRVPHPNWDFFVLSIKGNKISKINYESNLIQSDLDSMYLFNSQTEHPQHFCVHVFPSTLLGWSP